MAGDEGRKDIREAGEDHVHHRDPQLAAEGGVSGQRTAFRREQLGLHPARSVHELLAGGGQLQPVGGAVEDRHPERGLDVVQVAPDGGARDPEARRCTGERAVSRDLQHRPK